MTANELLRHLRQAKAARAKFVKAWKLRAKRANPENKIRCNGKGCFGCCYQLALAHIWEGALIAHYLIQTGQQALYQAAEGQGNYAMERIGERYCPETINAETAPWFDARIPCAFLDHGECSIYALRPIACSSYLVCSDPEICYAKSGAEVCSLDNITSLAWALEVEQKIVAELLGLELGTFVVVPLPLGRAVSMGAHLLLEGPESLRALIATPAD